MLRQRIARVAFVGLFCFASLAAAQPVAPSDDAPKTEEEKKKELQARIDEARRAYQAGELSYQAGDFKAAVDNFADAERLVPTPHATFWLAMSYQKDGRGPEAIATFERLLADPNAPKIGDEKLAEAKAALDELKKIPGKLALATNPAGASVSVDGKKKPGITPLDLELAPGRHMLSISLAGHDTLEVEMEVPPGSSSKQALDLPEAAPPPPAVAPVPLSPKRREPVPPKGPAAPRSMTGAWIMVGAAGTAAVVGGVFGAMALSAKGKYDDAPTNDHADAVATNAMLADIAFGSAITLGLASFIMFTAADSDERPPSSAKRAPARHIAVTPLVSKKAAGARVGWAF